ncbi:bifunctional 3-hydroxydecanoyl-ACP dehydratase/trans-2-decenoyl-ACP isomerase [candidate division KSB1 bacterium]|nr:bifunctional 3-hydroxydecanoyl-ACP dehydratase/trans-2-decenoyl-ACP isomerase [candidate division KSB1 bacterium]MCH8955776.1 bifunctional 3-hydroxydecanoyl-ACP dehydratase/trans-2-decenoyl-ACP isomerase [candidate division KSB1 bacterium]
MKYKEFLERTHFTKEELIAFAYGKLVEDSPAEFSRLPAPPFLMVDRVLEIEKRGNKGSMIAEKDVHLDEWFFQCHFNGDPVQPGCLGMDAVWQLLGFYCVCCGSEGNGRALGCKEVNFDGQIRPHNSRVRFEINVRRYTVLQGGHTSLVIGSGNVFVDDEHIYSIKDAKVGIFTGIAYTDYPYKSKNSLGGIMRRKS